MDAFIDILSITIRVFADTLIKGMFVSVLLIIIVPYFSKDKIQRVGSIQVIRWILIFYAFLNLLLLLVLLKGQLSDTSIPFTRFTGPYWWAYVLMLVSVTVIPLLLLVKRVGSNAYFLLFTAFFMNAGWLFESFVVHMTGIHGGYSIEGYNPYLPNYEEWLILLKGILFGVFSLIIDYGWKKIVVKNS